MVNPLVSICIPVYNGEKFLKKTIESILVQTFKDFELVILGNASTDKTSEIVKNFKDSRIKYYRNEKTVLSPLNWSKATKLAKGAYVCLFHADDIYLPEIVEQQVKTLKENPDVGAVFTEANIINSEDKIVDELILKKNLKDNKYFTYKELIILLVRDVYNPLICPSLMARRELIQNLLPYDYKNYKYVFDLDMFLRMAQKANIAILPEKLMNYRIHAQQGSASLAMENRDHNELYDMLDKFISQDPSIFTKKDLDRYYCHKQWDLTVHAVKALYGNKITMAKSLLKKSISYKRFLTSLTDFHLFVKFWVSVIFLFASYVGLGTFLAKLAVAEKMKRFNR